MSPFVCLFKPVVYGLYAGAQLTEYGGDLFLFVGRNEPFAFAAGEVEAAARKAALYLPSHLAYHFAGHFVIQLRHSAGVPAGCGTAEECTAAFAFQCGDVARVYGTWGVPPPVRAGTLCVAGIVRSWQSNRHSYEAWFSGLVSCCFCYI